MIITDLQKDDKYKEIMTQSCMLPKLSKSQNKLLQCIEECNSNCSIDKKRDAIEYIEYTVDKLEKRIRANEIKKKLIKILYFLIILII